VRDGKRLDELQRVRFHRSHAKFATLLRQAGETLLVLTDAYEKLHELGGRLDD
jgi:hypothetical protein